MVATKHIRPHPLVPRTDPWARASGSEPYAIERLLDEAAAFGMRAPELALVLGERAAALAETAGSSELWVRAESLVVSARVRLGLRTATVPRGVAALRAAEDLGDQVLAAGLRTDLAVCARSVGAPLTGLAALRPVLDLPGFSGASKATALCHLVGCMSQFGRKPELDRTLSEADRLAGVDAGLDDDGRLLARALLRVGVSAHRRRHGDVLGAADAARTGLGFLEQLEDPHGDGGVVHVRLVLQLICSLLDRGDTKHALELARPLLDEPVRAASIAPLGWLRLAVATRILLPTGATEAAGAVLREGVHSTEHHGLHALAAQLWSELAHVEDRLGRPSEAIECLHRGRAAEHLHARARRQAVGLLCAEFGNGGHAEVNLDRVLDSAPARLGSRPAQSEPALAAPEEPGEAVVRPVRGEPVAVGRSWDDQRAAGRVGEQWSDGRRPGDPHPDERGLVAQWSGEPGVAQRPDAQSVEEQPAVGQRSGGHRAVEFRAAGPWAAEDQPAGATTGEEQPARPWAGREKGAGHRAVESPVPQAAPALQAFEDQEREPRALERPAAHSALERWAVDQPTVLLRAVSQPESERRAAEAQAATSVTPPGEPEIVPGAGVWQEPAEEPARPVRPLKPLTSLKPLRSVQTEVPELPLAPAPAEEPVTRLAVEASRPTREREPQPPASESEQSAVVWVPAGAAEEPTAARLPASNRESTAKESATRASAPQEAGTRQPVAPEPRTRESRTGEFGAREARTREAAAQEAAQLIAARQSGWQQLVRESAGSPVTRDSADSRVVRGSAESGDAGEPAESGVASESTGKRVARLTVGQTAWQVNEPEATSEPVTPASTARESAASGEVRAESWGREEPAAKAKTRHDSEHGSVAARSVLDRLGISTGAGGGRRRAGTVDPGSAEGAGFGKANSAAPGTSDSVGGTDFSASAANPPTPGAFGDRSGGTTGGTVGGVTGGPAASGPSGSAEGAISGAERYTNGSNPSFGTSAAEAGQEAFDEASRAGQAMRKSGPGSAGFGGVASDARGSGGVGSDSMGFGSVGSGGGAPDGVGPAPVPEDDWLPRLKLPPSLAPFDELPLDDLASHVGATVPADPPAKVSKTPFTSTPVIEDGELGEPFRSEVPGSELDDDLPPDAGLADLLARALAEHQAGTSSAAALVKRLGGQNSGETRAVNGHGRNGETPSSGRHRGGS
ncbi:MAG TPA: hypothetical protein VFG87_18965 [Amycolatopsis sp.]|nr:hypothetical protein [Amycolatopsis sp.]